MAEAAGTTVDEFRRTYLRIIDADAGEKRAAAGERLS